VIHSCRSKEEFSTKISLLRVWRVEVEEEEGEDKVAADGYCGYAAMAQIINKDLKKRNIGDRKDRIEIGMAIRNLINHGKGLVREGWEKFNEKDLNNKERAERAYKEIMKEGQHFLSHKGLMKEYWLRDSIIEGRCNELDFSRWELSRWDKSLLMLRESQVQGRGQVLAISEWRRVLAERMMMYKDNHYYVREGGLLEMFNEAIEKMMGRWCDRLKLDGVRSQIDDFVVLEDRTPYGPMDSLIVAEAVISARSPPSILDVNDEMARNQLRRTEYGLETYEEVGLGMSMDMGNGTVLGTAIGLEQMEKICNDNSNGLIVIRNGVKERLVKKTDRPDVVYDEDIDHFYLNGVGEKI
jgi:hypothetical protein